MRFNINEDLGNEIKNLYLKQGLSCTKIGKKIGTTAATISSFLKKNGINVINKQNIINCDIENDIIPRYIKGESLSKLSKEFNVSVKTLSRKLKEKGIVIINYQNKAKFDETIFDNIDTEEKAYWLGFIFADGYLSSRDYGFELSLKGSDVEHLYKFNKFTKHNKNNVKLGEAKFGDKVFIRCRWGIVNKHLWTTLNSYGCTPRKSLTLEFPFLSDKNLIRHFIRGYFDGDGCLSYHIRKNKIFPKITFLGTMKFLNVLQNNLNKNIKTTILSDKRMKNTYILSISTTDVLDFLDYLYKDSSIYLDRKFNRYKIFKSCRSKQECLELLVGENGEDCDVNPVIIKDNNESLTL